MVMPFFELERTREEIARLSDDEIDRRYPRNTGANLQSSNPRLYRVACRLFFEFGCSQREVAAICQISRDTVSAIVEAEQGSGTSVVQRKSRLARLRRLEERSFAQLEHLLADAEAVKKAGPVAISQVWERIRLAADGIQKELSEVVEAKPSLPAATDAVKFLNN